MMNVLISLYPGYGLGDAVQMSSVLRHLRKYRPEWRIYWQAERGLEKVGVGIAHSTLIYGQYTDVHFDTEVQITLYDTMTNWQDRPNTRVVSCLHEKFGLEWDKECARYAIGVANKITLPNNLIAFHFEGDSMKDKKDLSLKQANHVIDMIHLVNCTPLILDWRKSELHITDDMASIRGLGFNPANGRDPEIQCAIISECKAFIGIDSGPSKCASATETPAYIIWTRNHPIWFHDPAPNTTHLVPRGSITTPWFESTYNVVWYDDPIVTLRDLLCDQMLNA